MLVTRMAVGAQGPVIGEPAPNDDISAIGNDSLASVAAVAIE